MRYGGQAAGMYGGFGSILSGNASITGGTGVPVLMGQSWTSATAPADTNENVLATVNVGAGVVGAGGMLVVKALWEFTSSANDKTLICRYSGAAGTAFLNQLVTSITNGIMETTTYIGNQTASSQRGYSVFVSGSGTSSVPSVSTTATVDTSAATSIVLAGTKELGTETIILRGYTVYYLRPVA